MRRRLLRGFAPTPCVSIAVCRSTCDSGGKSNCEVLSLCAKVTSTLHDKSRLHPFPCPCCTFLPLSYLPTPLSQPLFLLSIIGTNQVSVDRDMTDPPFLPGNIPTRDVSDFPSRPPPLNSCIHAHEGARVDPLIVVLTVEEQEILNKRILEAGCLGT